MSSASKVRGQVRKFTSEEKTHALARAGFAARAVLYGAMGVFALLFSFQRGGGLTDVKGVLQKLIHEPFGAVILVVVGLGLFAYAIFRMAQAVRDYDGHGDSAEGIARRVGFFAAGLLHVGLGFSALNLVLRLRKEEGGDGNEKLFAHWLLEQPLGRWLLGAVALGVIAFGISQAWVAWREKFLKELDLPREKRLWITRLCKVGLIARGAVFAVVGWLFLRAAIEANAERAGGIQGVWKWLSSQFMGEWLVPLLAVGLIAFAGYGITQTVYRKI